MRHVFTWFWPHWKAHKWRMTAILLLGLASAVLSTIIPGIIGRIIDQLQHSFTSQSLGRNISLIAVTALALTAVNLAAMNNRLWMNMRIELEMREKIFSYILKTDAGFFRRFSSGDIITRLIDDAGGELAWFGCSGIFRFIQNLITVLVVAAFMLWQNRWLTMFALLPMPLLAIALYATEKRIHRRFDQVQQAKSGILSFLEACFNGIRVVKAARKEAAQAKTFAGIAEKQKLSEIAALKLQGALNSFFQSVGFLCVIFVFVGGGKAVIDGTITLGQLIAFQFYSNMIVRPILELGYFFVSAERAKVSVARLEEIIRPYGCVSEPAVARPWPDKIETLAFHNVSYRTPAGAMLENVSFSVRAGRKLAVVGALGSGKSTLLILLARLADPSEGFITINGADIREFSLERLRRSVGYAPQETVIFSESIMDNITMHRQIPAAHAAKSVKTAQLEDEIKDFKDGFDTIAGTRGITLSGGQKQRISLARALAEEPEILVMDDSTSAMDAETENNFWQAAEHFLPGRICVFSTHRISTLEKADSILVLENGRAVEEGRHGELIKQNGCYAKIYERQKLEEELRSA